MHHYVMGVLGDYVKNTYNNPSCFTVEDLHELSCWGKTMKELLEADKLYNVINAMEDNDNSDVEMEYDEFITRLKKMYDDSDSVLKSQIKSDIMSLL